MPGFSAIPQNFTLSVCLKKHAQTPITRHRSRGEHLRSPIAFASQHPPVNVFEIASANDACLPDMENS